MERTPNPNAKHFTQRKPWFERCKPSDRVCVWGLALLVLATLLPVGGCLCEREPHSTITVCD